MSSPELQALLKKKGNLTSPSSSQPTAPPIRVCIEHAMDDMGNKTTSLQLVNAENLPAYSMSSISISDNDDNDQVKNIINRIIGNKPSGQAKGQKQSKTRRASDPTKFHLTSIVMETSHHCLN
ncbi:10042_t:CDS:2 [Paraglomus brasilianum]|uniref:10042_t:CDS:1 n=1 Tax=Paraglomus brasilianum TaxID=144538 RepID=A0A9N9B057_9GLOM|nr:10042_t:CDS:2 [Paraglomus brasilianum]